MAKRKQIPANADAVAGDVDETPAAAPVNLGELRSLSLAQLVVSPLNPRTVVEDEPLRALAESIRSEGLLENLVGRPTAEEGLSVLRPNGKVEILAGGRRLRALQLLAAEGHPIPSIPVLVRELADGPAFAVALAENLARRDIHWLDEAQAFNQALSQAKRGDRMAERLAAAVGRGVRSVQQLAAVARLEDTFLEWGREGVMGFDELRDWTAMPAALRLVFLKVKGPKIEKLKKQYGANNNYWKFEVTARHVAELPCVQRKAAVLEPEGKWGSSLPGDLIFIEDKPGFLEAQRKAFELKALEAESDRSVCFLTHDGKLDDPNRPEWINGRILKEDGTIEFRAVRNEHFNQQRRAEESQEKAALKSIERGRMLKVKHFQELILSNPDRGLQVAFLLLLGAGSFGVEVKTRGYSSSKAPVADSLRPSLEKLFSKLGLDIDPKCWEGRRSFLQPKAPEGPYTYGSHSHLSLDNLRRGIGGAEDRPLWSFVQDMSRAQLIAGIGTLAAYWVDLSTGTFAEPVDWPLPVSMARTWDDPNSRVRLVESFLAECSIEEIRAYALASGAFQSAEEISGEGKTRKALIAEILERQPGWVPEEVQFRLGSPPTLGVVLASEGDLDDDLDDDQANDSAA